MRKWIAKWLRLPKRPPERMRSKARAKALEEARLLYRHGAWARELTPGENPDGPPEIGTEPLEPR